MSRYFIEKEEFWRESVSVWEESGLSARQFCSQEGLGYQSFLSWKRRILENSNYFIELEDKEVSLLELNCGTISLSVSADLSSPMLTQVILSLHQASKKC